MLVNGQKHPFGAKYQAVKPNRFSPRALPFLQVLSVLRSKYKVAMAERGHTELMSYVSKHTAGTDLHAGLSLR